MEIILAVILCVFAVVSGDPSSDSALPFQLTGKMTDIKHFTKSLVRVVQMIENEQGEDTENIICGATALSQTLAVAPIKPNFAGFHNDNQGHRIITNYDDIRVLFLHVPHDIGGPEAVCQVEDIILESDYCIDNVEPELALIIFKCINGPIRMKKVVFPQEYENAAIPPWPMANEKAELLGWGTNGGRAFFREQSFTTDGTHSFVGMTNENIPIDDQYLGGFLLNRGKIFAIVVRQGTIELDDGTFATDLILANIFPRMSFIERKWDRVTEQEQSDHHQAESGSGSTGTCNN